MATRPVKSVTNEEILHEVMSIHIKIAEIQLLEAARAEREKVNTDVLYSHDRSINGNGKPGLKSDVQSLKEGMGRINWVSAIFITVIIVDIAARIIRPN